MKKTKGETQSIGGQAVIEGVMMRGKRMYALAVRRPDAGIELITKEFTPITEKVKILKLPILRGVVSFIDSLVLGVKTLMTSSDIALDGIEAEEEPSRFEQFLQKKLGSRLNDALVYFSVIVAVIFAVLLFMLLPVWLGSLLNNILHVNTWALGIVEGLVRICIFLLYMYLVSLTKEIKRVFQYHGAEHKTINCHERGEELTTENIKKHSRLHKRCGTSFMLIVMVVSMVVFFFVRTDTVWLRLLSRLILVPVIAGVSYEIIKWAGRSSSPIVSIVSFPGMCLQKLSTNEPDDQQIEVAVAALKGVLENEREHAGSVQLVSDRQPLSEG